MLLFVALTGLPVPTDVHCSATSMTQFGHCVPLSSSFSISAAAAAAAAAATASGGSGGGVGHYAARLDCVLATQHAASQTSSVPVSDGCSVVQSQVTDSVTLAGVVAAGAASVRCSRAVVSALSMTDTSCYTEPLSADTDMKSAPDTLSAAVVADCNDNDPAPPSAVLDCHMKCELV